MGRARYCPGHENEWDFKSASDVISEYRVPNPLPGVLGTPGGISNCHNKYESDASCTRRDLYFGDPAPLQMDLFKNLYFGAPEYEYTMKYLNTVSARRFNDSLMTNPYYTIAPLSGVVRIAEFFFMNRMMSNHSAARPEGWFDGVSLKSFFGVTGPDNYLTYRVGYERIPDNWYKRPTPYDFDSVVPDLAAFSAQHPEAVKFGGNIGEPNSFVGIDLKDLTGGALKTEDLLKGDNLLCLLYRLSTDVVGDMIEGAEFFKGLTGMSGNSSTPRGCPQFNKMDLTPFSQFPGFNASRPAIDPK
ncbi:uncharacterized protein [Bemisia tabaci]|uniref:uncharacterized protein n=1 Tax=Bemisia tabaci TaxID=7038 RepID=UPI003B28448C